MENVYFNKAVSSFTIIITLFLHYAPYCCYHRITMTLANARVHICPFVHPSVKRIGFCSHVSMSSKGFNQSPGAHQRVSFYSITVPEILIYFSFSGDSKQKFVLFLICKEKER